MSAEAGSDLAVDVLAAAVPARPLRSYPVVVSTGTVAAEWAEAGAPDGAVVVADYQIAARGRAQRPWKVAPGRGLGFSLVLRPRMPARREAWLYVVVGAALADVFGATATIEWPDEVHCEGTVAAALGVNARYGARGVEWAVVDLLVPEAAPPRGPMLAAILRAVDARLAGAPSAVLTDYGRVCATLGRRVRARLLGGTGPSVQGEAVAILEDGSLVLETDQGRRVPVHARDVRRVESAE